MYLKPSQRRDVATEGTSIFPGRLSGFVGFDNENGQACDDGHGSEGTALVIQFLQSTCVTGCISSKYLLTGAWLDIYCTYR